MEDPFDIALESVFAVKLDDTVVRVLHVLHFLGEHLHGVEVRHVFRELLVQLFRDLLVHRPLLLPVEYDSLVLNMAQEQLRCCPIKDFDKTIKARLLFKKRSELLLILTKVAELARRRTVVGNLRSSCTMSKMTSTHLVT